MRSWNCVAARERISLDHYEDLYRWSVDKVPEFWQSVWDFFEVRHSRKASQVLQHDKLMPGAKWFAGAQLNFAENLLRCSDERPAIVFCGENGRRVELSFRQLHTEVARIAAGLRAAGIVPGDRVAGFLPNCPEAVIAMLASASIGATWSSCSPDFGVAGVLDRFGQIRPRVLFTADGYFYAGKAFDSLDTIEKVLASLDSVEQLVVVPFRDSDPDIKRFSNAQIFPQFGSTGTPLDIRPAALRPSAVHHVFLRHHGHAQVHRAWCRRHAAAAPQGTPAAHRYQASADRLFYFTTCGWMMWNWLVSAWPGGATMVLFDGSPFHPDSRSAVARCRARERHHGFRHQRQIYLGAGEGRSTSRAGTSDLPAVQAQFCRTGSPLLPESYDYVYRDVKADVQLASISGGTDIISCFALGNPVLPVYRGELQCRGLGMAVDNHGRAGKPVVQDKRRTGVHRAVSVDATRLLE